MFSASTINNMNCARREHEKNLAKASTQEGLHKIPNEIHHDKIIWIHVMLHVKKMHNGD
jgi:hypothetical protein